MPFRTEVPRTTHTWLKPLYDYLDAFLYGTVPSGASGIANGIWLGKGVPITQVGNASGLVGLYGATGVAGQLATGTLAPAAGSVTGGSGNLWYNGGSGAYYTPGDVVTALKNLGALKP